MSENSDTVIVGSITNLPVAVVVVVVPNAGAAVVPKLKPSQATTSNSVVLLNNAG